jgi:Transposase DNA-binding/Transposase Tn5 dimerisation domain
MAMTPDTFPAARPWAEANFAAAELGDRRRTRRLVDTAERLAQQPQGSLPAHFSWNPLRAVYRLCNRPEVTHPAVTATHLERTRTEMAQVSGPVLVLHDTTELNFTTHGALTGTGPVGDGVGRGFLQHNSLAIVAGTQQVLGLAYQQVTTRTPAPEGETRTERRHRDRESQLWERGIRGVGPAPEGTCWVDVADRGADNFEAIHAAGELGHGFLFRACKDRAIQVGAAAEGPRRYLKSFARALPPQTSGAVFLPSQGGRPARTAQVQMAARQVWLLVPQLERSVHPDWTPVGAWVVRVWEPKPPADVAEPLEWILLSSLPAADAEQLHQRCDWYASRPLIEDYHRVEKTGCGEEDLRFETAEAMLPMLGVLAIVAVRVLQLRWWGRSGGTAPAESASTRAERDVLKGLGHRVRTARDFVRAVAELGGFLGRKCDAEPGWQTLWRGYRRLEDMVLGLRIKAGRVIPDFRECQGMSIAPS